MSLDRPQARIPIAYVTIDGKRHECEISRPWYRLHQNIYDNLGGTSGLDVQSIDGGSYAAMQPFIQEQSYADMAQPLVMMDVFGPPEAMQGLDIQQQSTDILQADCMQMQDLNIYQE